MNKHIINGQFAFATDVGKVREINEDHAVCLKNANGDNLLVICDGMGGQVHGETASKITVEMFEDEFNKLPYLSNAYFCKRWIRKVANKANKTIFKQAQNTPGFKGMGTTLTAVIVNKNFLSIGQIGDSRCYIFKENEIKQLTKDQSYVALLLEKGAINEEEMAHHPKRNRLMNALGVHKKLNIDLKKYHYNNEKIVLCSDGLYTNVTTNDMVDEISTSNNPKQKCENLVKIANDNGGNDNISVIYWEAV